jgi:hypothetical protein
MDFEMLSGSSNPMMILLGLIMALAMCTLYLFFAWILPIKKIRNKDTSKTAKGGYGFMLFLFGICPIIYLIYLAMKSRMKNSALNTGPTPVPEAVPITESTPAVNAAGSAINASLKPTRGNLLKQQTAST